MNSIRKIKITGLALGVAAFFATNLLAVPQSQQYPEYQPKAPAATVETVPAPVKVAPVRTAPAPVVKSTSAPVVQTSTPVYTQPAPVVTQRPVVVESRPVAYIPASAIGQRFDSNLYTVEKTLLNAPGDVGADYQYRVRVTALADIKDVRVTEHLPEGVTYVGATPDVTKSGNDLNWGYYTMAKGEQKDTIVTVRPNGEGEFLTTTKVCVDPIVQLGFRAGKPRLALEKVGPREAEINSQLAFDVKVSNVGTATAKNVTIVDNLPTGLRGTETNPSFNIGTLAAGESRTVRVPVTAVQQGDWVNKATATSSNADTVYAEAPVVVRYSHISIVKTGTERQTITRDANYNITVTNDGTTTLDNVTVTDDLPKGTRLLGASGNPVTQNNDRVVWNIASMAPGQSVSQSVSLTANEPMTTTNRVTARTGKGLSATASATTVWDGPPGVLTEIIDNVDPIRVGEPVVYTIRITNQGAYRELNSQIRVLFSDEVTPLSSSDKTAVINGKVVTMPDVILKPRGVITFTIQAKGAKEGVATTRLEFNSSFLPKPINKDETTYVY